MKPDLKRVEVYLHEFQQRTNIRATSPRSRGPIPMAIVTVSDTRTPETDVNAAYLREQITAAGHHVVAYRLIKDEADQVGGVLDELAATRGAHHPVQRRDRHRAARPHL